MADNVKYAEPPAGRTMRTDDVGGDVQIPIFKMDLGGNGAESPLVRGQQTVANSLPVTLASDQPAIPVDQANAAEADYDTGAGTVNQTMLGIALPASGGPVAGGTASNPVRTDTVGTTTQPTGGNVAHDAADSGNPVKVGFKTIAHGTNPTAVAADDRTDCYANRHGVPWVIGGHPNVQTFRLRWTAAQTDVALATVAAGLKIIVTSIKVTVDEAATVGVGVRVGFGTVNTPANTVTSGVVLDNDGIIPGGGVNHGDGSGILGVGADGEDLRITAEAPTSGSAIIYGTFYTIES